MLKSKILLNLFCLLYFFLPQTSFASQNQLPDLDTMIVSMLMVGFRGTYLQDDDVFLQKIKEGKIGHIILFDKDVSTNGPRNIESKEQLKKLLDTIKKASPNPMLIAIDQEGGKVARLTADKGFMDLPSAQRMGQENINTTTEIATKLGKELYELGININFAPVVDVNVNPNNPVIGKLGRSFNTDPRQVSRHAIAFGLALAKEKIIPTLKHFPGQGSATKDSHFDLPDITKEWNGAVDLLPYAEAFANKWPGAIMVAHIYHKGLDPKYPSSLSKMTITGLLRQGLGFNGVVICDDMQMGAITNQYSLEEAIALSINAGTDILLFSNNLIWDDYIIEKATNCLKQLVNKGLIKKERIQESYLRIQNLMTQFGLINN